MFSYRDQRSFTSTTPCQWQAPQDSAVNTHSSHEHLAQAFEDNQTDEEQEGSGEAMMGDIWNDEEQEGLGEAMIGSDNAVDSKLPFFYPFFSLTLCSLIFEHFCFCFSEGLMPLVFHETRGLVPTGGLKLGAVSTHVNLAEFTSCLLIVVGLSQVLCSPLFNFRPKFTRW